MIGCELCGALFENNKGGQLTNHLKRYHECDLEDYIIITKYNGVPPACACGLCEEMPNFSRGKFRTYFADHHLFSTREMLYKKKFGVPVCRECGGEASFHRGEPLTYCSYSCSGKNTGFSLPATQDKITKIVREKYGVENVSHLELVKQKISKSHVDNPRVHNITEETRKKMAENSRKMWADPEWRIKHLPKLIASTRTDKERKRRSQAMSKMRENPDFIKKNLESLSTRFSKLHLKAVEYFNLRELGFVGEQRVGRYVVDELHPEKKIVVEVNGDYIHANPIKYASDDVIRLRGNSYKASEKWKRDAKKIKYLTEKGYRVFVVWESDDWGMRKKEVLSSLL